MRKVRLIIFGALCAGFAANLLAEENLTRPVSVVLTVESSKNMSESFIEADIFKSIVQELLIEGFDVRVEESGPRPKGDYYIKAIYVADGTVVRLDISIFKHHQESAMGMASWQGELSMTMDVAIQEFFRNEVLQELPKSIKVTQSDVDKAASEGEEWALALIAKIAVENYIPPRYRPWRVDIGAHAIIVLVTDYFYYDIGVGARVSVGYTFKFGKFELQPAFVTGYQFLRYNGFGYNTLAQLPQANIADAKASREGKDSIIPFAVEFKAAYLGFNKIQPYFRVAFGGAWYQRKITDSDPLHIGNGVYPGFEEYRILLQSGLGAKYQLFRYLGVYADVGMQFFWGGFDNFISLTPGLGVIAKF